MSDRETGESGRTDASTSGGADAAADKRATARSFDRASDAYAASRVHREGADLALLAEWCEGAARVLDVATGAGHTARAVETAGTRVVACDAARGMVARARGDGVEGVVADAERLPFHGAAFDAVTCRIAAHHFPDPGAFVRETARVLEPGGVLAFEDNVAPPDVAAFLNRVERLRDPTHVESYTAERWIELVEAAGFRVERVERLRRRLDYGDWVARTDPPSSNRRALETLFAAATDAEREALGIEYGEDGVESFESPKVLLRGRR